MGDDTTPHGEIDGDDRTLCEETAAELVDRYHDLVYNIAHHLHENLPTRVPIEDMVGWGITGLLEAYKRFDQTQQSRFATYAYYRVRGAILDGCPEPMVRLDKRALEIGCNEVLHSYGHIVQNHHAQGTIEDRLSMLSETSGTLMMVYVLSESPSTAMRNEGAPQNKRLRRIQNAQTTRDAVQRLDDNERTIIEGLYFDKRTLSDIADELGLSTSWTCRLHTRALRKLRKVIEDDDDFADLRHALPV